MLILDNFNYTISVAVQPALCTFYRGVGIRERTTHPDRPVPTPLLNLIAAVTIFDNPVARFEHCLPFVVVVG